MTNDDEVENWRLSRFLLAVPVQEYSSSNFLRKEFSFVMIRISKSKFVCLCKNCTKKNLGERYPYRTYLKISGNLCHLIIISIKVFVPLSFYLLYLVNLGGIRIQSQDQRKGLYPIIKKENISHQKKEKEYLFP